MHPIIFKIGPVYIYSYGFMLAVAFLISTFLASRQAAQRGVSPQIIIDLLFWVLVSGVIGARISYVILNLEYFQSSPIEILMLHHGGLVWYGGLIFGVFFALVYLSRLHQDIPKILDMLIPYLALAQAIGRIGCLLNGCCYGKPAAWGLYFAVHKARLVPVQLYSSLAVLTIFFVLKFWQTRPHRKLDIFFLYLVLHSIQRFGLQFLRSDLEPFIFGLGVFQIISVLVFVIGTSGLIIPRCKR